MVQTKMMKDCIFCKIIQGEIPCEKIYEDSQALAFLDIHPINKGHVIVVPKEHTENLLTVSTTLLHKVMDAVQKIAIALSKKTDGINIGINNKPAAGQIVFHWHVHVIPRFTNDLLKHWPGKTYQEGEAQK